MTAFQVMIVFTMGHQLWWSQFRKVNGTWWINIFKDLINSNMHDNGITIMLKLCDSVSCTALKIKFFIKDFFSKCDQIWRKLWIWSHLLKKSLMENFIFCAVIQGSLNWFSLSIDLLVPILWESVYHCMQSKYQDILTR